MTYTFSQLFTRWDVPPIVSSLLALTAFVYVRGWVRIRKTRAQQFRPWRLASFLGGIFALFVAVASPLDTFSESLLVMHMAQHYVFISVAPPLILFGAPVVPLLRGLPGWFVRPVLGPLFGSALVRRVARFLVLPQTAWIAMNVSFVGWHIPRAYEFALRSENWHNLEHLSFFATSLLFWWAVIAPWPSRPVPARWILIFYLLLADFVNTGVSAFLCFSGRLLYPSYGEIPRPFGLSALSDQTAAGAFMWVLGSIVFLIPAIAITAQSLSPTPQHPLRAVEFGKAEF